MGWRIALMCMVILGATKLVMGETCSDHIAELETILDRFGYGNPSLQNLKRAITDEEMRLNTDELNNLSARAADLATDDDGVLCELAADAIVLRILDREQRYRQGFFRYFRLLKDVERFGGQSQKIVNCLSRMLDDDVVSVRCHVAESLHVASKNPEVDRTKIASRVSQRLRMEMHPMARKAFIKFFPEIAPVDDTPWSREKKFAVLSIVMLVLLLLVYFPISRRRARAVENQETNGEQ